MACDRVQVERPVRLAAVQIHGDADDRDVRDGKREQHNLPPRKTKQAVREKIEKGVQQGVYLYYGDARDQADAER